MADIEFTRGSATAAAILLGVTRRTVYRWLDQGRLRWHAGCVVIPTPAPTMRPRGPQASPTSQRYTRGRHTFRGDAWSIEASQRISSAQPGELATEENVS